MMFEEYRDRVGELITGIVQQSDSRYTLVQLRERVEALLPKSEQVDGERYDHSQRIKAVIKDVSNSTKGPSIIVSRRDPELIKQLFELEVPEIADGLVEITGVAREPGYRSKIAVVSHVDGVDPVGACVGPRGSRVRMVVSELRGEKIDIIPYNDEPARFVAKALSPARVREVLVDDAGKQATVIVPDDQLSLAIGREGQNARLAARLTGWRIDIRSETEFAAEEAEHGYEEDEAQGRCAAILSNGRRCPNAALPGSRYCGLEAHQALAGKDTDEVAAAAAAGLAVRRAYRPKVPRNEQACPPDRQGARAGLQGRARAAARRRRRGQGRLLERRRGRGAEGARQRRRRRGDRDAGRHRRAAPRPAAKRAGRRARAAEPRHRRRRGTRPRGEATQAPRRRTGRPQAAPNARLAPGRARARHRRRPPPRGDRFPGFAPRPGRRSADVEPAAAPPAARPSSPRRLRRGGRVAAVTQTARRRAGRDPGQLGLDRQGRRRVPRRLGARGHEEADGARAR